MKLSDLKGLPIPRYDLIDLKRYRIPNLPAQTTRGCPYACSYCEVTQVYGAKFRYRPPEEVVEEVRTLMRLGKRKFVYFVDDIFNAHRKHAFAVMEGLRPLKVHWTCLCTANVGDDAEMLDLMRASGCLHINIGMESVSPESLKSVNKKQNHADKYAEQFAAIRKRGIEFSLNVMFGLDGDTKDSFDATVDRLIGYKAPMSFMFILSPRVGLKIRDELHGTGPDRPQRLGPLPQLRMRLRAEEHDPPGARGGVLAGAAEVLLDGLDRPATADAPQPAHLAVAGAEPLLPLGGEPRHPPADLLLRASPASVVSSRPNRLAIPESLVIMTYDSG